MSALGHRALGTKVDGPTAAQSSVIVEIREDGTQRRGVVEVLPGRRDDRAGHSAFIRSSAPGDRLRAGN
jgi:hypothetical protein